MEIHTLFAATDVEEATRIVDRVMDADLSAVCPSDPARLSQCSNCQGALVNPADATDISGPHPGGSDWTPGEACAVCANSEHPGYEMPCAREHTAGATIHSDGRWLTTESRQIIQLLERLQSMLEHEGPAATKELIAESLADIKNDQDDVPAQIDASSSDSVKPKQSD